MDSALVHDSDLWFPDGSLVLLAEQTLFRVYAGILSRASPVFRDMLAIGHVNAEETYQGSPLVCMPGDRASDMRAFLSALHDSSFLPIKSPQITDIPLIVSVLRVSTKYDAVNLRRQAVGALQTWYADNLSGYQQGLEALRSWSATSEADLESQVTTTGADAVPVAPRKDFIYNLLVANIAIEASATILLPSALLHCCASAKDFRVLYDGVIHSDDQHYELHPEAKRAIFIGRPVLENTALTRKMVRNFHSTQACKSPGICGDFCRMIAGTHEKRGCLFLDPFFPFLKLNRMLINKQSCDPCRTSWETENTTEITALWENLPSVFDLPPWRILRLGVGEDDGHVVETAALSVLKLPELALLM